MCVCMYVCNFNNGLVIYWWKVNGRWKDIDKICDLLKLPPLNHCIYYDKNHEANTKDCDIKFQKNIEMLGNTSNSRAETAGADNEYQIRRNNLHT